MTDNKRRRLSQPAIAAVVRAIAVSNLLFFGLFVYLFAGTGGALAEWDWIVVFAGAAFFIADFYLLRYLFLQAFGAKPADTDG